MILRVIHTLGWVVFWLALLVLIFPAGAMVVEALDQLQAAAKKCVRMEIDPPLSLTGFN
jgi:hypothetical protein